MTQYVRNPTPIEAIAWPAAEADWPTWLSEAVAAGTVIFTGARLQSMAVNGKYEPVVAEVIVQRTNGTFFAITAAEFADKYSVYTPE